MSLDTRYISATIDATAIATVTVADGAATAVSLPLNATLSAVLAVGLAHRNAANAISYEELEAVLNRAAELLRRLKA
jgi:hypothetical protein